MRRYTTAERDRHEPRACPGCGHRVAQGWVDVTCRADPEPIYTPGRWACATPNCPYAARLETTP